MLKRVLIAVAGIAVAGSAAAQTAQSLGAPAGDAEKGRKIYMQQLCYTCHGTLGQGGDRGSGPKIYPDPFPFAAFVQQVRRPRESMPSYNAQYLGDQELADIYHYLFSTKVSPAAKDIPLLKDF